MFLCSHFCSRGQLGHGDLEKEEGEARQVEMLAGLRVTQIAAGGWHSVALTDAGDMYVWGWNCDGQLGLPYLVSCNSSENTYNKKYCYCF